MSSSSAEEGEIAAGEIAAMPPPPQAQQIEFAEVLSSRNTSLLAFGGYEYGFENFSKLNDNTAYYRCRNRPPYCKARIEVGRNWIEGAGGRRFKLGFITCNNHNHPPRQGSIEVYRICNYYCYMHPKIGFRLEALNNSYALWRNK
jgi:hypothetical protein